MNEYIELDIADAIMERPYSFTIDERHFFMYQPTLGHLYLIQPILAGMGMNEVILRANPYAEAIRLCIENGDRVCRVIAYLTIKRPSLLFKENFVKERIEFFKEHVNIEDMAQMLILALTFDKTSDFMKHLGIDREQHDKEMVMKAKEDNGNTYTFGGKSTYGTLLASACSQLGLTPKQAVWGISYVNLKMMLADNITSIYLTDEEKRRCRLPNDRTFISGDDASNMDKIMAMFND